MPCNISKGLQLQCKDSVAGIQAVYFINYQNLAVTASADDVVSLQGPMAAQAGFGIGAGLGYSRSN